jgi:hypothetical protein
MVLAIETVPDRCVIWGMRHHNASSGYPDAKSDREAAATFRGVKTFFARSGIFDTLRNLALVRRRPGGSRPP